MIRYFKTDNQRIQEEEKIGDGVWVQMLQPTHQECAEIAEVLNVDIEDIQAALDEEESSRIELQDGYTLILVDIPTVEIRHEKQSYTTIPLGIILTQDVIVTVCTDDTPVFPVESGTYANRLCKQPCEGVQHEEKNAFCVSDLVPHSDKLSDESACHRQKENGD